MFHFLCVYVSMFLVYVCVCDPMIVCMCENGSMFFDVYVFLCVSVDMNAYMCVFCLLFSFSMNISGILFFFFFRSVCMYVCM